MKIINGKELANVPNGTVFSDITDPYFKSYSRDMKINGLHIMCGHDEKYFPVGSGKFNGVLHMLNYVTCDGTEIEGGDCFNEDDWFSLTDTDYNDYDENNWVVVYNQEEVRAMIKNLIWALTGCTGNI